MGKTLGKLGITNDTPDVADCYGIYTKEAAQSVFHSLDDEYDNVTLDQIKARFSQLFVASTNTNNTYHKWQTICQTSGSEPARIKKIHGELADLKGSLPRGSLSDYTQTQ